jgi:hypothetical protein
MKTVNLAMSNRKIKGEYNNNYTVIWLSARKKEWHLHDGTLPNTETNYLTKNNLKN